MGEYENKAPDMDNYQLQVSCAKMGNGGKFPVCYTGRGENRSPEFELHNLSEKAQTVAITLEDLSHPIKNFTHWVIWNLPARPTVSGAIPPGKAPWKSQMARQGIAYGFHRYAGPKPPKGKTHRYRFTVYALDGTLELKADSLKRDFLKKAEGHILQEGSITAEFE